jgi:hypothetical protein
MLKHETLEDLFHRHKSVQNSYNAAFPLEQDQLNDEDMVDIFHRALDPERYGEYKVYLENKRRQKPRSNATEAQLEQFMFFLNLTVNLLEIYNECKGFQYCEKPAMPKIMAVEQAKKGKGNGTKPKKPSDEVEDATDTRQCYTCGKDGHIARRCPNRKSKENQNRGVSQPPQPSVNPIVQPPLPTVFPMGLPHPWMQQAGHPNMLYPNMLYPGIGYHHRQLQWSKEGTLVRIIFLRQLLCKGVLLV